MAASVKVRLAFRVPLATGWNTTVTVQVEAAARLEPQVLPVMAKSAEPDPVIRMLLMLTGVAPVLPSVTVWPELALPKAVSGKERLAGATVTADAPPVPDNATVCGLLLAALVSVSVAVRLPEAAGVKVTFTVQVERAARLEPQVLLARAKSPAFAPEMVTLLMAMAIGLALDKVTACGADVVPSAVATKARLAGAMDAAGEAPVPDRATD